MHTVLIYIITTLFEGEVFNNMSSNIADHSLVYQYKIYPSILSITSEISTQSGEPIAPTFNFS
jgi:hypothetical protein